MAIEAAGPSQNALLSGALILMYHRVARASADPFSLSVTPEHFLEQLEVLEEQARPISLSQLNEASRLGAISPRSVVLTFDDGYADNLEFAKPLLEQHDTPATVFVTTGFVGNAREMWWGELERVFLEPGRLPQVLNLTVQGIPYSWVVEGSYSEEECRHHRSWMAGQQPPTSRHDVYFSVWRLLQLLPGSERCELLDQISAWANSGRCARPSYRGLSTEEVRSLRSGGLIEIGAHTVTHPALPQLSPEDQRLEVELSKSHLEKILGCRVSSFAYPYGATSEASARIVREAGFDCACSTIAGAVWSGADPFHLPRVQVEDWDGAEFTRRLTEWFAAPAGAAGWGSPSGARAAEPLIRGRWLFRVAEGNIAGPLFPSGDPNSIRIEIEKAATRSNYDIQLNQPGLAVLKGHAYEICFRARADSARPLSVGFAQAHEPWNGLGLYATIDLTPEWRTFRFSFTAVADEDNGRIHFDAGSASAAIELSGIAFNSR